MQSRTDWGARNTNPPRDGAPKRTLVIHHSAAFGGAIDRRSEQRATMRQFQREHMDGNGWADIGYLAVVFQPQGRLRRARAYVGRHDNQGAQFIGPFLPAAQLNANAGTIPVCTAGNFQAEGVKRSTKAKLVRIARECRQRYGITHLAGHYELTATACPGEHMKAALGEIAKAAGLRRGVA